MLYQQSEKAKQLQQSEIRNMSVECDQVKGINLSQGICDLPLESILSKASYQAMIDGQNHYTQCNGIRILREQIAKKAQDYNHIIANEDNITVSCGATGALYSACYALFNPGDEIILFQPYYGYHEYTLLSLNLVPRFATLSPPDWGIDLDELQGLVTPKTKAIIICTPSNPCGKVFSKQELEQIGEFCIHNNLIVLTDEIYEYITYDNATHISPASLPVFEGRTITISGYSKTFSITGWRIGYCIADKKVAQWIGNASDLIYVCPPSPLQFGVAQAIMTLPPSFYDSLQSDFKEKRDLFCKCLSDIGIHPYIPQGAYYVLADVSQLPGTTSKAKAMYLLEKTGVASVPGSAFYKNEKGNNLVRFCFAKDMEVLHTACDALKKL